MIITFNYTKTLEKYFNTKYKKIIHIHNIGDNGQPVLGHIPVSSSNKYRDSFLRSSEKSTGAWFLKYRDIFEDLYISKISFLGVSYSKPDMPYYKSLDVHTHSFLNDCLFECYYHSPSDVCKINNFESFLYKNNIVRNLNNIHLHKDD